jgi:protoheme IX farnesyltransferase
MLLAWVYQRLSPIRNLWRDYLDLTKPGVTAAILLSAMTVLLIASDGVPIVETTIFLFAGCTLAVSGANALNCCLDADIDALMTRTAERPLAAQRLDLKNSITFATTLVAISFVVLSLGISPLAGIMALLAVFVHVVVYTRWLKRRSPYSILVSAISGAIAPLIGWVAARGGLQIEAFAFFAIIFCWTPTHFWSLALSMRSEYLRAGIPALPVVSGPQTTRIQIGRFAVLMVVLSILPVGFGLLKSFYALSAILLGGFYIYFAVTMMVIPGLRTTWRLHKFSTQYLALLFAAMALDWVFYF